MRNILIFTTVILISVILFQKTSKAQGFYDPATVSNINIHFYDSNWDHILDSLMSVDSDDRILADLTINGVTYDSCGVRYKGNSSYSSSQVKNPLNIKLNYLKDQDYEGYYTLKFSNVFKDPSFVREVLAYEIANKYMPASKAGYANIYVDGVKIGLYTNVQAVNDIFTSEHYYSEDRPFFEGTDSDGPPPMGCFSGPPVAWSYMGTDTTNCYSVFYDSKSGDHYQYILNLMDTFNNYSSQMEYIYNVDRHLWSMAYDIAFVNLDAPISMTHNFYVYYDLANRFNYIKWDMNECFGVFKQLGSGPSATQLTTTDMQQLDPFTNNTTDCPVLYNVWQTPRWAKMYIAHMKTLMSENIASGWYMARATELQTYIDTAVQNDPNKFFTYAQFSSNLNSTVDQSVGISELMSARNTYLNSTTYFQYTAPTISGIAINPTTVSPNFTITITANITNANYAYLGYRYSLFDRFEKIEMFDDGAHNDGASGDGVYGADIDVYNSDVQYYIYAENNDAGMFSPERAEYEYYTITLTGDVVINEFMASNSTIAMDQNGEYDDWVELYNNSSSPVSLNDYYLSDDMGDPYKFQFPDTSIAANGYLIIWTDDDTLQSGLHTGFKLSAAGEVVVLSDASKNTVDMVSFSVQTTDISHGRYPNGTGPFMDMLPTFSAENMTGLSVEDILETSDVQVYPNPASQNVNIVIHDNDEHIVQVFSIDGKMLISQSMNQEMQLDISMLDNGLYLILIDQMISKKLIKTN
ncbi:MAG: CotH kinase family protein [Bacteroidales bacterium]|nr:CotH kinase family protein [Bacteroidales bacterium]